MDTIANMQVGGDACGCSNVSVSIRFVAERNAALSSFRFYWINHTYSGYGGGNGGRYRISLMSSSGGEPGSTLASLTTDEPSSDFPHLSFPDPATLVKGHTYHLVWENIDAHPTDNFGSVDFAYTYSSQAQPTLDGWAILRKQGSGSWRVEGRFAPIIDLTYANGAHQGVGYMEVEVGHPAYIGGSAEVRQGFTAPDSFTKLAVRVARTGGAAPDLRISLTGAETASDTLSTTHLPALAPTHDADSGDWIVATFPRMPAGHYTVTLSAPSSGLWTRGIQQGDSYNFNATTYLGSGELQVSSGGSWSTVSGLGPSGDLQFYIR